MLALILKLNHRKNCIQLLTFLLLFFLLISVGAACLRPQIVYASVAGTIAGYILTLFASFNTAITNPEVVSAINNTFGQMSMVEADAALIDQGIASIAASTGFDMASIFANTAEEAAQVIASLPAGSVTEEAIAATAGVNIAAGASACAASATGAILPVIGGIVLPAVGAVALGVAGGVLINHIREKVSAYIKNGLSLNTSQNVMNSIPSGAVGYTISMAYDGSYYVKAYSNSSNVFYAYVIDGNMWKSRVYNLGDSTCQVVIGSSSSMNGYVSSSYLNPQPLNFNANSSPYLSSNYYLSSVPPPGGFTQFSSWDECTSYVLSNRANLQNDVSPDLIGKNGNQTGTFTDGNYTLPNIYSVYNYGDTVINYINPNDYNTFIQNANQNTSDGLRGEDTQGSYFDSFVNPYIQAVDEIPENPNPDNPNPEQKPTVPYPDPEEYPDAIPEVNPIPGTDIAPTAIPYPELPEPTDEEITETNDKITPFDLKNKFPFCLPFDIHKALLKLKGAREAPYFVWEIPFGDAGQQTVTVDLSAWDEVASILRLLELLLFIVGLAVATRNLIGGT